MKRFLKAILACFYILIACLVTAVSGCEHLTPTRVPPLTDVLGYDVYDFKGWTTVGLNEMSYTIEVKKLGVWRTMMDLVNVPALQARDQVVDWWSMGVTAGLFGGLPLALRKVPKGYVKKD